MPIDNRQTQLESILAGLQLVDPRLYDFLSLLLDQVINIAVVLEPIEVVVNQVEQVATAPPTLITEPGYVLLPDHVRIFWVAAEGATFYELRKGTVWETATFMVKTPSTQVDLLPITGIGDHTFLIKSVSSGGTYSETSVPLVVTIPPIGTIAITAQVIDNNVLLSWATPVSAFRLDHYRFRRNGVVISRVAGSATFAVHFETVAGEYTYGLRPRDIAGNSGPISEVTVTVNQPPDFDLQDEFFSNFSGTKINVLLQDNGRLLAVVDTTETWDGHFASRGWASIQAQIDAGFPLYAQPSRYP